jgi:WD40 repeat protein
MSQPILGLFTAMSLFPFLLSAEDSAWIAEPTVWPIPSVDPSSRASALALNRDGTQLALAMHTGEIILLNATDGSLMSRWQTGDERIHAAVFLPTGNRLATAGDDGAIQLWDVDDGSLLDTLAGHTRWVTSLAVSAEGRFLASGSYDRTVRLWNLEAKPVSSVIINNYGAAVKSVDFAANGLRLVSGMPQMRDYTALVRDLETKEDIATLKSHGGQPRTMRFSPDGSQIATATEDGLVRLWNATTGERSRTLTGHAGVVSCLAYSRDGTQLATGGFDQTVRIWNPATGERTAVLRGATAAIIGLAFSKDDSKLFVASEERSVRRYRTMTAAAEATP